MGVLSKIPRHYWYKAFGGIVSTAAAYQVFRMLNIPALPTNRLDVNLSSNKPVVVVGSGVAGVATAYHLALKGFEVTVIDAASRPASECSHATAGGMLRWHTSFRKKLFYRTLTGLLPWSEQFNQYKIRWSTAVFDPHFIAWGLTFAVSTLMDPEELKDRQDIAMAQFNNWGISELLNIMSLDGGKLGRECGLNPLGTIEILDNSKALHAAEADLEAMPTKKVRCSLEKVRITDSDEVMELEPMFKNNPIKVWGARYFYDSNSGNCGQYTRALAQKCEDMGVQFKMNVQIRDFSTDSEDSITAIHTNQGVIDLPNNVPLVLAAGSWTPRLFWKLGLFCPIYPIKGYNVVVDLPPSGASRPSEEDLPQRTVMCGRLYTCRFGDEIRTAAIGEADGWSTEAHAGVVKSLKRETKNMMPALASEIDAAPVVCGLRPMAADGVTIAGKVEQFKNLYVNVGPGYSGWKSSSGAGELTARWIEQGDVPDMSDAGFDPKLLSPHGRIKEAPWTTWLAMQMHAV